MLGWRNIEGLALLCLQWIAIINLEERRGYFGLHFWLDHGEDCYYKKVQEGVKQRKEFKGRGLHMGAKGQGVPRHTFETGV